MCLYKKERAWAQLYPLNAPTFKGEENNAQMEFAQQLHVTDKAVSRRERGIGYPDIQLLPALSESMHVSVLN